MDLAYMLETEDEDKWFDVKNIVTPFNNIGKVSVEWTPLAGPDDEGGGLIPELEGAELVGKPWTYRITIKEVTGLPVAAEVAYCQYEFFGETFTTESVEQNTRNPVFNYSFVHHIECVTDEFVEYLNKESMPIDVFVNPFVEPPPDLVSTSNQLIVEAIRTGKPVNASTDVQVNSAGAPSAPTSAPRPRIPRAVTAIRMARANALMWSQISAAMEDGKLQLEMSLTEDELLRSPRVQGALLEDLKALNPDWPLIEIVDQKTLHMKWAS